jgi:hypothetical protein
MTISTWDYLQDRFAGGYSFVFEWQTIFCFPLIMLLALLILRFIKTGKHLAGGKTGRCLYRHSGERDQSACKI